MTTENKHTLHPRRILIFICIVLLVYYFVGMLSSCSVPNDATRKSLMPGETVGQFIKAKPIIGRGGGYNYLFLSEKGDTLVQKSPVSKNYKIGKWYII